MDDEQFLVTLPSNSSMNYFPDNSMSNYKTKLAQFVELDNSWEVALTEIQYPRSWMDSQRGKFRLLTKPATRIDFPPIVEPLLEPLALINFLNDTIVAKQNPVLVRFGWENDRKRITVEMKKNHQLNVSEKLAFALGFYTHDGEDLYMSTGQDARDSPRLPVHPSTDENDSDWRISVEAENDDSLDLSTELKPGYYNDDVKIIDTLNQLLKKRKNVSFVYDLVTKKVSVMLPENGSLSMVLDKPLGKLLGFGKAVTLSKSASGRYPMDYQLGFYNIYLYCDVVRYNIVGDTLAPLLRVVQIRGKAGEYVSATYDPPYYKPLSKFRFDTIEVALRNDAGDRIPFKYGRVVATLHFRRRPT